jgi:hypothetical protein
LYSTDGGVAVVVVWACNETHAAAKKLAVTSRKPSLRVGVLFIGNEFN